eukprot:1805446-Rhodomonas_salina.6
MKCRLLPLHIADLQHLAKDDRSEPRLWNLRSLGVQIAGMMGESISRYDGAKPYAMSGTLPYASQYCRESVPGPGGLRRTLCRTEPGPGRAPHALAVLTRAWPRSGGSRCGARASRRSPRPSRSVLLFTEAVLLLLGALLPFMDAVLLFMAAVRTGAGADGRARR